MNREDVRPLRQLMREMRRERLAAMPALPLPATLIHALYLVVCMTYLSAGSSQPFAAVVLFSSAVMAALTLRSPWLIGMMTVPAALSVLATGSLSVAALPIAMLCSTAFGAFVLLNVRAPLAIAIPPLSFVIGMLITGDVFRACLTLLSLPAALMLAHTLRRGMTRVRAICHVAVAMILPLLLVGICYVWVKYGATAFGNLAASVSSARAMLADSLANWQTGVGEDAGRVVLEGMELALASALFNILPGTVLACLAVFAYLANLICLTLFRTYERTEYLSRRVYVLAVSLPAAAFFLMCYLVLFVTGEGGDIGVQFTSVVAENLYLALLPAMLLVGLLCCFRVFLRSSHRFLLLIGAIWLTALSFPMALTILSVLGAGNVIWRALRTRRRTPPAAQ